MKKKLIAITLIETLLLGGSLVLYAQQQPASRPQPVGGSSCQYANGVVRSCPVPYTNTMTQSQPASVTPNVSEPASNVSATVETPPIKDSTPSLPAAPDPTTDPGKTTVTGNTTNSNQTELTITTPN